MPRPTPAAPAPSDTVTDTERDNEPDEVCESAAPIFFLPSLYVESLTDSRMARLPQHMLLRDLAGMNPYPILPCNMQAVELFLSLGSAWDRDMDGAHAGFRSRADIRETAQSLGIAYTPVLFEQVLELEAAAIYYSQYRAAEKRKAQG